MIRIEKLNFSYQANKVILQDINSTFDTGKIHGLVGAIAVGKTTLLKIIAGHLKPKTGTIRLNELSPFESLKNHCHFFCQSESYLFDNLTSLENINLIFNFILNKEIDNYQFDLLKKNFQIDEYMNYLGENLSLGTKKKISLIPCLIHQFPFLFLDEPINGLDTQSVEFLKYRLLELKMKGVTIILSAHLLEFIFSICDNIFILSDKVIEKFDLSTTPREKIIKYYYQKIGIN